MWGVRFRVPCVPLVTPLAGVCVVSAVVIICQSPLCSALCIRECVTCVTPGQMSQGRKSADSGCENQADKPGRSQAQCPPCVCLLAMTIPRRDSGNIWAANRVSVTVCYFRFKTDRLLVTPESTESFSRVSLSKCGRLFPVFIQIRPKISGAQYLSDSRPGCDKRVQCPALGTLYWQLGMGHMGCGDQLWPYIGWWWPGGDHWPTFTILSRYRLQRLRQQQPHLSQRSLLPRDHHGMLHNPL